MKNFDVVTQELPIDYDKAFAFVADPTRLPEWTVAFRQADDKSAIIEIEGNRIEIGLTTNVSAEFGQVDWLMVMPDGSQITVLTRLHKMPNGNTLYNFVYILPEALSEEMMQAAITAQTIEVHKEFANLVSALS